jgi:hypothetical protein
VLMRAPKVVELKDGTGRVVRKGRIELA